jgi:hypothetical protein
MALRSANCEAVHVIVDRSAVDTVSNFTSISTALVDAGFTSVAVATSRSHCRRAQMVGTIVLGSCGLHMSLLPVDAQEEEAPESWLRCFRDGVRALCWVFTGFDGSTLAGLVHPSRENDVREWQDAGGGAAVRARSLRTQLTDALSVQVKER